MTRPAFNGQHLGRELPPATGRKSARLPILELVVGNLADAVASRR